MSVGIFESPICCEGFRLFFPSGSDGYTDGPFELMSVKEANTANKTRFLHRCPCGKQLLIGVGSRTGLSLQHHEPWAMNSAPFTGQLTGSFTGTTHRSETDPAFSPHIIQVSIS